MVNPLGTLSFRKRTPTNNRCVFCVLIGVVWAPLRNKSGAYLHVSTMVFAMCTSKSLNAIPMISSQMFQHIWFTRNTFLASIPKTLAQNKNTISVALHKLSLGLPNNLNTVARLKCASQKPGWTCTEVCLCNQNMISSCTCQLPQNKFAYVCGYVFFDYTIVSWVAYVFLHIVFSDFRMLGETPSPPFSHRDSNHKLFVEI